MRTFFFLSIFLYALSISSQGFQVKEFKQNINDGSAFHAPLDSTGSQCGLIKVRTDNPDLRFSGSIVGKVENKLNEYWAYLTSGSKQMIIMHPNYLPLNVDFIHYGIEKIDSKATYVLVLRETNFKKEKCGLTLTVKPNNAKVIINDNEIDNLSGDGLYHLYLPKGNHICRIIHSGYRPQIYTISSGKDSQNLNIVLESVMANLQINCKTETAEIIVDGESKGNGSWNGELLPSSHHIEARQNNFESQILDILLDEKESRTISIPELKRLKGKLKIVTIPTRIPVMLDGELVGISPCEVETETGEHYVSCNAFGCLPYRSNININSDAMDITNIVLKYDNETFIEYPKAYQGNIDAMSKLANNRMCMPVPNGVENVEEAVFWRERIEEIDKQYYSKNPEEIEVSLWIMTYEHLADKYEKKGDVSKAISCYKKILTIMATDWKPDPYREYGQEENYKNKIENKIKKLEIQKER